MDVKLESRLVDLARTSDRVVFDSWALAWICPVPVLRVWIESDLPSRARKCQVSLGDAPRPLAECEGVLRAKDGYNRAMFRNQNNSTNLVITRRWTALQAPNGVVTTIRFRDAAVRMPYQLACSFPAMAKDITVTGQVADADLGNLFPRLFRVVTAGYTYTVHLWWWKFASPVRDGDTITIRGSRSGPARARRHPRQQLHQPLAPDPQPLRPAGPCRTRNTHGP